jgi:acyl-CoA synthetase (AMP-forming)/AMP-acid ligase II
VLSHHPSVLECAIVGKPDPVLGERVHAFVVARDGQAVDAEALRGFCGERLADYKVPETVTALAAPLPRNSNGKVQKQILREMLAAG